MCLGQVRNVNVVPDAGAVRGGVVLAKDLDVLSPAESDVKNKRDQVRLRLVRLSPAGNRARHVEIAQAGITEAMNTVHPGEHLLHQELRLSVGVGWKKGRILKNRSAHGFAIQRRCRRKYQPV